VVDTAFCLTVPNYPLFQINPPLPYIILSLFVVTIEHIAIAVTFAIWLTLLLACMTVPNYPLFQINPPLPYIILSLFVVTIEHITIAVNIRIGDVACRQLFSLQLPLQSVPRHDAGYSVHTAVQVTRP
jgi:hypothetical protein